MAQNSSQQSAQGSSQDTVQGALQKTSPQNSQPKSFIPKIDLTQAGGLWPTALFVMIALVFGLILGIVNHFSAPRIQAVQEHEAFVSRQAIFPEADDFRPIDKASLDPALASADELLDVYEALQDQKPIGIVVQAAYRGYAGAVPAMVGVNRAGDVQGIIVLDNKETPGLGTKVSDDSFLDQFIGASADHSFAVKQAGPDEQLIAAVTGATFSSKAITLDVNCARAVYQDLNNQGRW